MQAVRRYRTLPNSSPTGQIARAIFKLRKNPEVAEMLKQRLSNWPTGNTGKGGE